MKYQVTAQTILKSLGLDECDRHQETKKQISISLNIGLGKVSSVDEIDGKYRIYKTIILLPFVSIMKTRVVFLNKPNANSKKFFSFFRDY